MTEEERSGVVREDHVAMLAVKDRIMLWLSRTVLHPPRAEPHQH